jgi:hypothetical protein
MWQKPDDLELVAECESLPELTIVRALLEDAGIETMTLSTADSSGYFDVKGLFGPSSTPRPFKLLVHPKDAEEARSILAAPPEEVDDREVGSADE